MQEPVVSEQLVGLFKQFMEAVLVEHNLDKVLKFISEDIIGIGMGAQGVVSCKADVARILGIDKTGEDANIPKIEYLNLQVRCYDGQYGTVCGVVKITIYDKKKTVTSTIGQIVNFRKQDDAWMIYALQATPIFEEIEELEAYPIKFAENILESYRQQEQIAKNAQRDNVAVYLVNYTKGIFENAVLKSDFLIPVDKGDSYEETIITKARSCLKQDAHYIFISTFSLGNVIKAYQNGQTELSLEYEMYISEEEIRWMRTIVKLYVDTTNDNLMGCLYVVDIDKEKCRELELQKSLELDSMTGLYNKKYSELKIAEKLLSASPAHPGVFFMVDLDNFKNINDTYGHQEGDRIIRETAACIAGIACDRDITGRLGGDEFCIYFQDPLTDNSIREKANTLCDHIRQLILSKEIGCSCSIGITICDTFGLTFEEIYQRADNALYYQKKNGRNGYTIFEQLIF